MPRGGFTDVGQHTGTVPPNAAWPLVYAVIQVVLEQTGTCAMTSPPTQLDPSSLHLLAMAHFELWLLSLQSHQVSPPTCTPAALNACMRMLQSAASKAAGACGCACVAFLVISG
eukprot:1155978-Pelagomonas_calceolata.AAC.1